MYPRVRYVAMNMFFFFNDTATTEIYTLSLHDALPIYELLGLGRQCAIGKYLVAERLESGRDFRRELRPLAHKLLTRRRDRKSTRLNSSHANISYAVFCLKKKSTYTRHNHTHPPLSSSC